jgi:hypothetical protein
MARRSLLSQALQHLDAGHLSTEEALRAALRSRATLERLVDAAATKRWRRPTVRKIRVVPAVVVEAALARVTRRVATFKQVRSVHWGVRRVRGRRTSESVVVVHVAKKIPPKALRGLRMKVIPKKVVVKHRGRQFSIGVDVQAVKVPAKLHTEFLSPGDHGAVMVGGVHIGSLGAIVSGSGGDFAITAGHVAASVGPAGATCLDDDAGTFTLGKVRRNCFDDGIDIAAIGPVPVVPNGAVLDETVVRDPRSIDIHRRLSLRLPGQFTPSESHIDDVGVTRSFATPAGNITMDGLTTIVRITEEGDSGSAAVDEDGAVVGFVIGADSTHTYLLPARRALNALEDSL